MVIKTGGSGFPRRAPTPEVGTPTDIIWQNLCQKKYMEMKRNWTREGASFAAPLDPPLNNYVTRVSNFSCFVYKFDHILNSPCFLCTLLKDPCQNRFAWLVYLIGQSILISLSSWFHWTWHGSLPESNSFQLVFCCTLICLAILQYHFLLLNVSLVRFVHLC